jgi:hypothetical protein
MDPNRKPTIWQYARRKFVNCQCLCVLATSMPIVKGGSVSYMAICLECNEQKYICTKVEDVDLDRLYLKADK